MLGLEAELRELIDDAHLRRHVGRGHGVAGVPQQIIVAMLDEIAAVNELQAQLGVRGDVGEALIDRDRRLRRAAVEARERHVRRLRGRRDGRERTSDRKHGKHPIHSCPPLKWF